MRIVEFALKTSIGIAATLAVSTVFGQDPANAASRPRVQNTEQPGKPAFKKPVIAVVSVKDQRVTLYDADGSALRSRVSSGQTGLETPSGVYSVLQKEAEHYSNVYDDAAMPFMQRITWSGIALHAGVLPGYPASHGCVRMAYQFAHQIFPMTRLGMRVVISPDDFAPVPISHALLPQPSSPDIAVATNASFSTDTQAGQASNPFQPDVSKWPARKVQLDELRRQAALRVVEADAATAKSLELRRVFDKRTAEQAQAQKVLKVFTLGKRAADGQLARADLALWTAKLPRKTKAEQEARDKAIAATRLATDAIPLAAAKVAMAEKELAAAAAALDGEPAKSAEARVLKKEVDKNKAALAAAKKALTAAISAKRAANDRLAYAEKALYLARIPLPTKYEDAAMAKAMAATKDANAKASGAAASAQTAEAQYALAKKDFEAAEAGRVAAVDAMQRAIRATLPVSIFVSLKSQHVYVRQGHEPVADMPIAIAYPKLPIGTHVYTAVDYADQGASLRWTAVSIGRKQPADTAKSRLASLDATAVATDLQNATAALDRVTMPNELTQRLAGYVWPGSSVIVSDEEMSAKETGKATDFVVLISSEPQGGLKSRPKQPPSSKSRRSRDDDDDDDDRRRRRGPPKSTFFFW